MSIKKVLWLIIVFILILLSIDNAKIMFHNKNNRKITIDRDHKIVYRIYYIPFQLLSIRSFIDINPQGKICKEYVNSGLINLKYEYDREIYSIGKYNSFEINEKFKYKKPIKIILEAKEDISKCDFNVFVYPGKFNILINGIIFFWLPVFLVYKTMFAPIIKYIFSKIKIKIQSFK